jgi:iron complex outermembrane receptor protein
MNKAYLLAAAACVCVADPALAQRESYQITLPAQSLAQSLFQISELTGIEVVFTDPKIKQQMAPSIAGSLTVEQMLVRLMQSSAYHYAISGNVVRVFKGSAPVASKISMAKSASPTVTVAHQEPAPAAVASPDTSGLQEIVVTAQKRETRLQDTPISIAVLGGQDLEKRHVVSLANIGDSVPGLRIVPFAMRSSALLLTIRGIGSPADVNQPTRDQGVGVYVDGVYLGRAQGLGAALFDVERIEVLKGPQGTLFGRNTEGGAVSIVTKKPSGAFRLNAAAGISNFGGHEAVAHIDLPSFNNISLKFDGLLNKRGGTVDNPLPGAPDFNEFEKRGLRASALWEPSPDFSALYSFDISRDASTPYYFQPVAKGTLATAPLIVAQPDRVDRALIGVPQILSVGKTHGHALTLEWEAADHLLVKSISAYRKLDQTQGDNLPYAGVFAPNAAFGRDSRGTFNQNQFSQEFQLLGNFDSFNFVAGAFYFRERVQDSASSANTLRWNATGTGYSLIETPVGTVPLIDRASKTTNKSTAVFAQATWTPAILNDVVHISAGGRYTHDRKNGSLYIVNGSPPVTNGVTAPLLLDLSESRFDPMVNIAYDVTPDIMVYGKWSTGYQSGGSNSRSLIYRAYSSESVSSFEIGAKTELLDRRVRLNLAAFTTDYKDQQVDFAVFTPGVNRRTNETGNAQGTGRIRGLEADLTIAPVNGLTLSASYAYLDANLPGAPNPFVVGNPEVPLFAAFAPEHSASGAIDYEVPLADATLSAHLDGNYVSKQYTSATDPLFISENTFLMNGRIAMGDIRLNSSDARLTVAVWSRNLLNRSYRFYNSPIGVLGELAAFNDPRTYGVTASIRF